MENSSDFLTVVSIKVFSTKEGINRFRISLKNNSSKNIILLISESRIIHGDIQDQMYSSAFDKKNISYATDAKDKNIIYRWDMNTYNVVLEPGQSYDDEIAPLSYCKRAYDDLYDVIVHEIMEEPVKILIKYKMEDEKETHTLSASFVKNE
jgi:hypothetical protein